MKGSISKNIFAPILVVFGLVTVFFFQNCSKDVAFDRPSAQAPVPGGIGDTSGSSIDTSGPVTGGSGDVGFTFTDVPTDRTKDAPPGSVTFDVTVPSGGNVDTVTCTLNGVQVACTPGQPVTLPPSGPGPQTITVEARTDNGFTGTETITWTVYNNIVQKQKLINVTTVGDTVDIIINVDNSQSMTDEQKRMAASIANFMEPFKGLNYHIAVITASQSQNCSKGTNNCYYHKDLDYVDGKFLDLSKSGAGTYCVKKSVHTLQQAQDLIAGSVVRDNLYLRDDNGDPVPHPNPVYNPYLGEGNPDERGVFTTYLSFERMAQSGTPESSCMRPNTPKHVIMMSDEEETTSSPYGDNGSLRDLHKSDGNNLRNYVSQVYGSDNIFKFHSIVTNRYSADAQSCINGGGGWKWGDKYVDLSIASGGEMGSICDRDYSDILANIGKSITDSFLAYQLDCVAVANDSGSFGSVVNNSGGSVGTTYGFSGDKVEFAELLGAGQYTVTYYCYQ